MASNFIDLSHPITKYGPCTLSLGDRVPRVTFEEGDSHGTSFVTSRLDNLYSNAGTHIDLPGHLIGVSPAPRWPTIGNIPIERFIGPCAILDFSQKRITIREWYAEDGTFDRERFEDFDQFIATLQELEISKEDLELALTYVDLPVETLSGMLIYTDSARLWRGHQYESWEYEYFFAPYLSQEAADLIINAGLTFVGVDAFHLEDPITNFGGDELPLIVNLQSKIWAKQNLRTAVKAAVSEWQAHTLHDQLLSHGVAIYENLNIPAELANCCGRFSGPPLNLCLDGLNDSALTRPYIEPFRRKNE